MLLYQWLLLLVFGGLFLWLAPYAKTKASFFKAASKSGQSPKVWMLTSSLVISWIFAKSITNAANLSLEFGMVGGVSYAVYYLSFLVAGVVIYQMRTKGGFKSLHDFLNVRFGIGAVRLFSLLVGFRLFNEVWSNTLVIGSYFGAAGSLGYYAAIGVFTTLTLAYTLKGGMSSSILTDAIQMVFFGLLLFVILVIVLPSGNFEWQDYWTAGEWRWSMGLNFFFVALIQIFSYPFHDAVLTDRGFLSDAKTTLRSFLWAGLIGFICILLFSLVGVHARLLGLEGQAAVEVGRLMGVGVMLLMNFIMITSAASTLDSTFSSSAKLITQDLGKAEKVSLNRGRISMVLFALVGTIPIFLSPTILSATTISGTMVLGLAPIFLFWKYASGPLAFYLSVGAGLVFGILFAMGAWPVDWVFFPGKYGDLLSVNILATLCCFLLFAMALILNNGKNESHT